MPMVNQSLPQEFRLPLAYVVASNAVGGLITLVFFGLFAIASDLPLTPASSAVVIASGSLVLAVRGLWQRQRVRIAIDPDHQNLVVHGMFLRYVIPLREANAQVGRANLGVALSWIELTPQGGRRRTLPAPRSLRDDDPTITTAVEAIQAATH